MKLTSIQKNDIITEVLSKLHKYQATTTKDAEIIIMEMMNEEFDSIYHKIESTWKNPTQTIIRNINKVKIIPLIIYIKI